MIYRVTLYYAHWLQFCISISYILLLLNLKNPASLFFSTTIISQYDGNAPSESTTSSNQVFNRMVA